MDPNLPRWVFASLNGHLAAIAADMGLRFSVEGVDADEPADAQESNNVLFQMTGPFAQHGIGQNSYNVETFLLITDLGNENPYGAWTAAGRFQSELLEAIPVFRRGGDDTLVACLNPDRSSHPIRLVNFGEPDRDLPVKQVAVIGKHILEV